MAAFKPNQIEFGLERDHGAFITIPSLFFGGVLTVNPGNTALYEFEQGEGRFNHGVIVDRNGFEVTFWANEVLRDRIASLGVPVVSAPEVTDDAYMRYLMRADHEEDMGYDSHHGH